MHINRTQANSVRGGEELTGGQPKEKHNGNKQPSVGTIHGNSFGPEGAWYGKKQVFWLVPPQAPSRNFSQWLCA
jgi:hypothetical protein